MTLGSDNARNYQTENTWQCWMVNTITGEEKLIAYGYASQEECQREAIALFANWEIDLYPSSEGWREVYRQDSSLKMAQYWRDYYQDLAEFWSQRYEEILHAQNQHRQQLPQVERKQRLTTVQQKKPARRRRVKRPSKALPRWYKGILNAALWIGRLSAGILLWAIAVELVAFVKYPPKDESYTAQHTSDIPLSIRELFGSKKAPGSMAVGVAEGNLTPSGEPTSIYLRGHTDPGNFATNRGFCSWNKAQNLSIAEADKLCLESLQWHSVAIENQLLHSGLNPEGNKAAIVMGTDLWNQSNSAGPKFPFAYKAAKDRGLQGREAHIWARVEAFRNEQQQLDASGLFGICRREPYYRQQLVGLAVDSEPWRWNCIKLDQMRRVVEIEKVLKSNSLFFG